MQKNSMLYLREFGIAMVLYCIVIVFCVWMRPSLTGIGRYLLAVLPLIAIGLAIRAILRALNRMDEMERKIQFNALAVAGAGIALFSVTYGIFESFAGMPPLSMWWTWLIFNALWIGGCLVGKRNFR